MEEVIGDEDGRKGEGRKKEIQSREIVVREENEYKDKLSVERKRRRVG